MTVNSFERKNRETGKREVCHDLYVRYTGPDGKKGRKFRRLVGVSRRFADRIERNMYQALTEGTYQEREEERPPTLETFSKDFMEKYVKVHNKPSEQHNKEMHLKIHLIPFFGEMGLDEIRTRDIDRYTALKLQCGYRGSSISQKGLSAKTVNGHLSTLRRLLVLAKEWEFIETIPAIRRLKETKPEYFFFDFEEAERLISATELKWKAMIVIGLKTGARLGELLALRWEDVDLVAGRIFVRRNYVRGHIGTPKSGKSREIPLSDDAIEALKAHRHLRGELVFCNDDGSFLTKEQSKHILWRPCKKAGLRMVGWHVLRHTFASHLAMRGAPAKAIQELLGHSSIEMTNRYMHLSPDARRDAVKLLDKSSGKSVNNASIRNTMESK